MKDNINDAREQTARDVAAFYVAELLPQLNEARIIANLAKRTLEPGGPFEALERAYEARLAEVTRERDEARAKIERYTKAVANVTAQEAWFVAACQRCQGTGIGTPEARAAGENWSAAWDARAAAWEERDAAIKALCAEVRACPAELGPREVRT